MGSSWHRIDQARGATGIPVHRADELDDARKALFATEEPALLPMHGDAEPV